MNSPTTPGNDARFLTRLESVRGIAALCVAMVHSFVILPYAWEEHPLQTAGQTLIHIFFAGPSALIVFFVISGYVLSLSLDRSETTLRNVSIFYMRRIFRIYPAHLFWIFIALILLVVFYSPGEIPAADTWFNDMNSQELSVAAILLNVFLILTSLIPGEWTLTLELLVYLIYPLIYIINRNGGKIGNILLLIFLLTCSFIGQEIRLFYYLFAFYFGLAAPSLYKRYIGRISDRKAYILLWTSLGILMLMPVLKGHFKFISLIGQVLAGGYLIFACIYIQKDNAIFRFLDRPRVQRMGQISYSFYVCHFLINYWIAYFLFGLIGSEGASEFRFLFMMIVAAISIPCAHRLACLSYDRVEAPMMKYSSNLSKSWRKPAAEPQPA